MISDTVVLGDGVIITHPELVNLYGCKIGSGSRIGPFVEIQKGVHIGSKCKIQSHSFLCEGVTLENGVFVGHGVMFVNDLFPAALNRDGELQVESDWPLLSILIKTGASIGSNATILGGLSVGVSALIGAGSVVTKSVPDYAVMAGVPATLIGDTRKPKSPQRRQNINAKITKDS